MARDKDLIELRNERIRKRFQSLCTTRPHWRVDYIISILSGEFCLAPRTIENILKY